MPTPLSHPGVFVEELASGVRTILGVPTSIAAFVGLAPRGPINDAAQLHSFADYERCFGGLAVDSEMGYAVHQFFRNGGTDAYAVRIAKDATFAEGTLRGVAGTELLKVRAKDAGTAGNGIEVRVDHHAPNTESGFDISFLRAEDGAAERYADVSMNPADARYVLVRVNETSRLVKLEPLLPEARGDDLPAETVANRLSARTSVRHRATGEGAAQPLKMFLTNGSETPLGDADMHAAFVGDRKSGEGIYALEAVEQFNVLCLPGVTRSDVLMDASAYCEERRAFFVIDAPPVSIKPDQMAAMATTGDLPKSSNAAVYYPWIYIADPLRNGAPRLTAPSGTIAGIYARNDVAVGVWKAPAGMNAKLSGVNHVSYVLNDLENGVLNALGVNCLRMFPLHGPTCWGARTLRGADTIASEYKYVQVRRLALFLEGSVSRGTQWVVFESNNEQLWAQIRLNVESFMNGLFRVGAFVGKTAQEAYFVSCDQQTTTQNDINLGVVHIEVGFAPFKPAEFVVIRITQCAGQLNA